LIVKEMLTADEIGWLDAYHARVAAALGPEVDEETRLWLKRAAAPL
jgi:Xaa-Pro aminopeptidase